MLVAYHPALAGPLWPLRCGPLRSGQTRTHPLRFVALHRHFEYCGPMLVGDDDYPAARGNALQSVSRSDFSPSARGFPCCLFSIFEFGAFVVEHGHLATSNVEEVARHEMVSPATKKRLRKPIGHHAILHPRWHEAVYYQLRKEQRRLHSGPSLLAQRIDGPIPWFRRLPVTTRRSLLFDLNQSTRVAMWL